MKLIKKSDLILIALAVVIIQLCLSPILNAQTVIASGPDPSHLIAKDRYIFWSDASETPISKVPICGGIEQPLVGNIGVPATIKIRGQNIYWIDQRSGMIWSLNRTSLDGTETTILDQGENCTGGTADIVVDDTNVYCVKSGTTPNIYTINKIPISGGTATSLVSSSYRILGMIDDDTHIYWAEDVYPDPEYQSSIKKTSKITGVTENLAEGLKAIRGGLAITGGEIFFADSNYFDTLRLMKVSISGGDVTVLATITKGTFDPVNDVKALAVDNQKLFWVDKNAVNAMSVNGGNIAMLASVLNDALDLKINTDTIFWTETTGPAHGETGTIKSVSKSGGIETVLVQDGDAPRKLELNDDQIYWTEGGLIGETEGFGRIAKISIEGGVSSTVITGVQSSSPAIEVDNYFVYIADKWRVKKLSINGGVLETLVAADDRVEALAIDQSNVYWIESPFSAVRKVSKLGGDVTTLTDHGTGFGPPGTIRVHNNYVYWMDNFSIIEKIPITGGSVTTLASDLPFLNDFVVDDTSVYFSEHDTGAIRKMSINGGTVSTLIYRSNLFSPRYLAQDIQYLYWIDQGEVSYIPKDGGDLNFISSVESNPYVRGSVDVDETGIYWTDTATGNIQKYSFGLLDSDGDCIPDNSDDFPYNSDEWYDTDSDGIGNNSDLDDDNDGFTDEEEINCGSDPLNSLSRCSGNVTLLPWLLLLL